ncbi:MAG: hypothetical protein J2P17_32210, partial [Mycobacterium sp.]|nr:hypothetical protein [Mycobacterium sp.]
MIMSVFKKLGLMLVALLAIAATALAVSATATAYPPGVDDTISASSSTVAGGQPITFSGTGRVPGETITVTLHSDPIVLGTTVVGPD